MTNYEPRSFNLIDQPWLTVRTVGGDPAELSLVGVFENAHRLAGLTGDVPTQVFALTRLLLAVLHGAVDGPGDLDEWEQLWLQDELPHREVRAYLERHRARFDLFEERTPFLQVAGLRTQKGEVSELNKLIADMPNGHPFFTTRGGRVSLSYAEAARWVVHCHAFDPSGIKSGAVGDDRVKSGKGYPIGTGWAGYLGGVLPEGPTLRDTLLLNLIPSLTESMQRSASDLPPWERSPLGAREDDLADRPAGPVDLYTWQSRRLRLVREGGRVTGVLICNGDRITPQDKHGLEPHSGWRRSKAQEKKLRANLVYMPREHEPQKAVWRGLQAMLPGAVRAQDGEAAQFLAPRVLEWIAEVEQVIGGDFPVRLRTFGMSYGAQSATTTDIVDDVLSLRVVLLRAQDAQLARTAVTGVRAAEEAAQALGRLAENLAVAAGAGKYEREAPRTRATELAYAELDPLFRTWLRTLRPNTDPVAAATQWHCAADRAVRALGADLLRQAPMKAWSGRTAGGRLVTSAHADRWFRIALRAALRYAYPKIDKAGTDKDEVAS
ncbi:type I-E CRISPR-associated protein Cse1/CasA [Saccharothrix algeriensis]|uniref:CRISPR system Cascade subunit CasA n=1 Tax=Saccharothrix algeriensis TaxID=173560 RepID=A0A8T8HY87_9PSEU|nr:type I-E CRISPR-associated protein Cse1/CasA [Saccharothrix algeriensis]MBM7814403.1 CRISPR system Cascade subunit CasA [Saccharothrix algeriensis]QTR02714.1 type I-E CRISPR-associated protein Cse1/CasA [Saccharothrix algeriensis]